MPELKLLLSKVLLVSCIVFHIYISISDPNFSRRWQKNTVANVYKYLNGFPQEMTDFLALKLGWFILAMMGTSILMLFSTGSVWKVTSIFGCILWNVFDHNYLAVVPNHVQLREWLAIIAGLFLLIGWDRAKRAKVYEGKK